MAGKSATLMSASGSVKSIPHAFTQTCRLNIVGRNTELNDPAEQRRRFHQQLQVRIVGGGVGDVKQANSKITRSACCDRIAPRATRRRPFQTRRFARPLNLVCVVSVQQPSPIPILSSSSGSSHTTQAFRPPWAGAWALTVWSCCSQAPQASATSLPSQCCVPNRATALPGAWPI